MTDNIRYELGGVNKSLWEPADWAGYLARVDMRTVDAAALLHELRRMPHGETVELWNRYRYERAGKSVPELADATPAEQKKYLRHLANSLRALMESNFVRWSGLHNFLGYELRLPCELDARVNRQAQVEVKGALIALSGRLSLSHEEYRALVLEAGGRWSESGVARVDYLIAGEWASESKLDLATRHHVSICSEEALRASLCAALGVEDAGLEAAARHLVLAHPIPRALPKAQSIRPAVEWLRVCITGTLDLPRKEYAAAIEAAGGLLLSGVTKDCQLLVAGESPGSKLSKAEAQGVRVCTLAEFRAMLAERGVALS